MRSSASTLLVLAACSAPATTPPARPPPHVVARSSPRSCPTIAAHCDATIDDDKVFSLVRRHCWACHATDGIAGHDFPDLAALRAAPVVDMVGSCQMPPDGSPLGEADRKLLVEWATCK